MSAKAFVECLASNTQSPLPILREPPREQPWRTYGPAASRAVLSFFRRTGVPSLRAVQQPTDIAGWDSFANSAGSPAPVPPRLPDLLREDAAVHGAEWPRVAPESVFPETAACRSPSRIAPLPQTINRCADRPFH